MKSNKQRKAEIQSLRKKRATKISALIQRSLQTDTPVDTVSCNPELLAPYNSYGVPRFVERGYYVDETFICRDCHKQQIWKASQQKWWYEVAKGNVETSAIRCRLCRRMVQERKAEARRVHLDGIARKQEAINTRSG